MATPAAHDPLSALETEMTTKGFSDDDALKALEEDVASDNFRGAAPAWKPENAGDFIAGTVMNIFTSASKFDRPGDEPSKAMIVRQRSGEETTVYCNGTVLKNQFDRSNPQIGDLVAVKYLGMTGSAKNAGQSYQNYQMKVVRP